MAGPDNDKLPYEWRERTNTALKMMGPIFPLAKQPKVNVPNSLLESYISLYLLADKDFQTTKKLAFEKYFMIFSIVQNQLKKQPQHALAMAKLIQLNSVVTIPKEDRSHFYQQFGQVVKTLLSNKEFNTFYTVLNAFMDWAKSTDLEDLNFMVPEDQTVQQLLQNFMQNSKIDLSTNPTLIQVKMFDLQRKLMENSIQDLEVMEQFCLPAKEIPLRGVTLSEDKKNKKQKSQNSDNQSDEATSETPEKMEPPELAQKLVEVQYMLSGKPVPKDIKSIVLLMYLKFKEQDWPEGGSDQELQKYIQGQQF